jgi:hypothetical protein
MRLFFDIISAGRTIISGTYPHPFCTRRRPFVEGCETDCNVILAKLGVHSRAGCLPGHMESEVRSCADIAYQCRICRRNLADTYDLGRTKLAAASITTAIPVRDLRRSTWGNIDWLPNRSHRHDSLRVGDPSCGEPACTRIGSWL